MDYTADARTTQDITTDYDATAVCYMSNGASYTTDNSFMRTMTST